MGKRWQMLIGAGAGLLVAGYSVSSLVGCSNASTTSSRPSASQLGEGLTILDASDPGFGVSAAYVKSGRVVYIESRVGLLKPDVYRSEGRGEPDYEMDLRMIDHNNDTFFVQRGGDNFADKSWSADVVRSSGAIVTNAERQADWSVAQEGAAALVQALPATFKDHVYHLTNFAQQRNPTTDPDMQAKLAAFEKAAPPPASDALTAQSYSYSNGTYTATSWVQVYVEKYSRGLLYVASHSAADIYSNPNVGSWTLEFMACNHGTCPNGGDGMNADCYSWNGGTSNVYASGTVETGESSGNTTGSNDGTGGCQTAYDWDSGSGSHLCNDDAAYELYQSVHGTTNQSGWAITGQISKCDGDFPACGQSPSNYGCNCAGSTCSGDWNTPTCGGKNL